MFRPLKRIFKLSATREYFLATFFDLFLFSLLVVFSLKQFHDIIIAYFVGSVAQWIEQFRPKEKVVRSTRTGVTKFELKSPILAFFRVRSINNRASHE